MKTRYWKMVFLAAAFFNYAIGFPLMFARQWSFDLSFAAAAGRDAMAMILWADFGFFVVLIGFGYHIISRDVFKNRGIVLLGIIAKLFDVFNLTILYLLALANPIVLIPAFIDAVFVVLFVLFCFQAATLKTDVKPA